MQQLSVYKAMFVIYRADSEQFSVTMD